MSAYSFKSLKAQDPVSKGWLYIDQSGSDLMLDCSFSRKGDKLFPELPRRFRTIQAAKGFATRLAGEKLFWAETGHCPSPQPN